jgi:hypothetical protein
MDSSLPLFRSGFVSVLSPATSPYFLSNDHHFFPDEPFALGRTLLDQAFRDDVGFMSRVCISFFSALASFFSLSFSRIVARGGMAWVTRVFGSDLSVWVMRMDGVWEVWTYGDDGMGR